MKKPEEQSPSERDGTAAPSWTAFVSMGMTVAICVAAGVLLGIWLDSVAKTSPLFLFLGLVAGFTTPVALSTGEDHPFALFGYLLMLDCALLYLARRQSWW